MGVLAQPVAILGFLEEVHPAPPLLPDSVIHKARVRRVVEAVNSSIQPIQKLKVMRRLFERFGTDREENFQWATYWIGIARGFEGVSALLEDRAGAFAFGAAPTHRGCGAGTPGL